MFDWLIPKSSAWKPSEAAGPAVDIRLFSPLDRPIAGSARRIGEELEVEAADAGIRSLFDVLLPNLEQCRINYEFSIRTQELQAAVYPQMWCRIPEMGQFFSNGIDRKLTGSHDWTSVSIPSNLEKGQLADLLHLNLAFEGPGKVWLKAIKVNSTPTQPAR